MQPKLAVHGADLGRLDQAGMRDRDRVQGTLELLQPEAEKAVEDRELGAQIVVLPHIGLQQRRVIGHPVENVGRSQAIALELPSKVTCRHAGPPDESSNNQFPGLCFPIASEKDEIYVQYQGISSISG